MKKLFFYISILMSVVVFGQENNDIIKLPNVFSPNGDGVNDQFIVKFSPTNQLTYVKITFFNRYGEIVSVKEIPEAAFKDNPMTEFYLWDGRTNAGEKVSDGTYFYILEYHKTGETFERTGTVAIF